MVRLDTKIFSFVNGLLDHAVHLVEGFRIKS
jgi:hypothetical protein